MEAIIITICIGLVLLGLTLDYLNSRCKHKHIIEGNDRYTCNNCGATKSFTHWLEAEKQD
jgi:hypothetical protein